VTYNASFNPPASAVISDVCPANSTTCAYNVTNNDLGPLGLPGPSSNLPPVELRMPDPNIKTAQTQFWSLGLQREVARNTIVELSYSGAHGVHLYDIETSTNSAPASCILGDPLVTTADPATGAPCPFYNFARRRGMRHSAATLNTRLSTCAEASAPADYRCTERE